MRSVTCKIAAGVLAAWVGLTLSAVAAGQEKLAAIAWDGLDTAGKAVKVPAPDRPTVIAFVRAGQGQSEDVLRLLTEAVGNPTEAQVLIVVSGLQAAEQGQALGAGKVKYPWPVVMDPTFATSGQMGVHVWPTTVVVRQDGRRAAHLAGLPDLYAVQLEAYLKYAAGKIDEAALKERLEVRTVVADSDEQKAGRHLRLAERLLDQGRMESAAAELEAALKVRPKDPQMQLSLARALALLGRPSEAMAVLDGVPAGAIPAWQRNLVRGRVLVGLGKWDDARAALTDAVKLNPDPSEAYYLSGVVHQHAGDWARAAEAFRLAFENTNTARGKIIGAPDAATARGRG